MSIFNSDGFWVLVDQIMGMIEEVTEYPVLIYDTNGRIVRATDKARVGDLHTGAYKIMQGKVAEYAVTPEEASQNPLVREGYSCPICMEGQIIAGLGITGDLTITKPVARLSVRMIETWIERHDYQLQLEHSEKKYRDIFNHSLHGIYQTTLDGRFITANKALSSILGYPDPEALMDTITDIGNQLYILRIDRKAFLEAIQNVGQVTGFETKFRHRYGGVINVRIDARLKTDSITNTVFIEGLLEDVTERKKAEDEMRNLRNRQIAELNREIGERKRAQQSQLATSRMLQLVLDSIPVRVFWKDLECNFLGCNQPFAEDAGRNNPVEIIGMTDFDFPWTHQEAEAFRADDKAVMTSGESRLNFEESQTYSDGVTRWLQTNKIPMRDEQGNVVGVLGTYEDITQRKEAEKELQRLRNYLINIIDSMPSVLIGVDKSGRVTQWNRQAELITGLSSESAKQQDLTKAFPRLGKKIDRIKQAIQDREVIRDIKVPHNLQDEIRYEDLTIFPLFSDGIEGAVIRVDDVTERVRLEEMMIQSEKMLSLGGLAAGMAHEVNNPLAGILQNASVLENRLLGELPANHKAAEAAGTTLSVIQHYLEQRKLPGMIKNIRESGSRAAAIVKNMLSFARKSEKVISSHDLGILLDQTIELLKTDYDMKKRYDFKQIRIEREYDPAVPPVPCEAGKVQQVFMNILKNGAEAMAERPEAPASPVFVLRVSDNGAWVRVEIEDNGPGIDEAIHRRIFEPFFTTKPLGKGTGLGLSVSYFIVTENHGGELRVQEAYGGGTRFIIRLPKAGKE